jgi:ribosome-binding factor A
MPLNNRQREQMLACCGEIQEDDGVDPRRFFKSPSGQNKQDRKTQQLCQQVEQTLSLVLSGEFSDELLQSLIVESVIPAPNASQLLVTVRIENGHEDAPDPSVVLERLDRVVGRLRSEVAVSITRKRAPGLKFQVVSPVSDVPLNDVNEEGQP